MPTHEDNGHRAGFWDDYFGGTDRRRLSSNSTTKSASPTSASRPALPARVPAKVGRHEYRWLAAVVGAGLVVLVAGTAKTRVLWLAGAIASFISQGPPTLVGLLMLAVVSAPCVLLHEAGHALAADLRVGAASITLKLLPDPRRPQGMCHYDASRATRVDTVIIALAGPAASALGAFLCVGLYRAAAPHGPWHDVCWGLLATNVSAVLVNLLPLSLTDGSGRTLRLDGRVAWEALRSKR